ncbi:RES family NAD+ phosphorylase [Amorphus orientalis]|uniref:RES domain-containing protein n=1 Tax=Amorphus orientalis TaxID=649198 RepID=A0AAE3VRT5_9HYPH|nr:RES family NAD+ phosphorylase [Amorphus orientalis]MDQ0316973.1 RES domain-containing protein [Amorphus orientalis]
MPASTPRPSPYSGVVYRCLNPIYARQPLSGRGAALFGGRFNAKGTEALYTSLSIEGAIREANQVGTLQPTTIVAYRAEFDPVFDTRSGDALGEWGLSPEDLADPDWRGRMARSERVPTQEFAIALETAGYAGLLVRSFARGATADDLNLVLWRWNTGNADALALIDDEGRLSRAES